MQTLVYLLGWNQLVAATLGGIVWLLCLQPFLRRRPAVVHALWMLVLLKFLTPALLTVPVLPATTSDTPTQLTADASTKDVDSLAVRARAEAYGVQPVLAAVEQRQAAASSADASCCESATTDIPPSPITAGLTDSPNVGNSPRLVLMLILFSLLGSVTLCFVAVKQITQVRQILLLAHVESGHLTQLLREVAMRFQVRRPVQLHVVDARVTPMLWATPGGASIVVSKELAESLSDEQLRSIFAHELAHLVRRDHWTSALSLLVASLFWWNPIAWLARKQLSAAAEACCDALALERLESSRKSYAQTLLTVVDTLASVPHRHSAWGIAFGSSHSLRRRFEMISDNSIKARAARGLWVLVGVVLLMLTFVPARGQTVADESAAVESAELKPELAITCCPKSEAEVADKTPDPNWWLTATDSAFWLSPPAPEETRAAIDPAVQETIDNLRWQAEHEADGRAFEYFDEIGGLAEGNRWKQWMPLTDQQATAISRLDDLVWTARKLSYLADADFLEQNPEQYRTYVIASDKRRRRALRHAEYMMALGLLTPQQSAFVTQRKLALPGNRLNRLRYDTHVQNLIALTSSQKKIISNAKDVSLENFLTDEQQRTLAQLAVEQPLPKEPPELQVPTDADLAKIDVNMHSFAFNSLGERQFLNITAEQQKLIDELTKLTQLGLYWISNRPQQETAESKKLIRQAEEVLLQGILTQLQAHRLMLGC